MRVLLGEVPDVKGVEAMKTVLSYFLSLVLMVIGISPGMSQRSVRDSFRKLPTAKSDLPVQEKPRFDRVEAYFDGSEVLIRWTMAVERDSLGFEVYSIKERGRIRVTEELIAGSSLLYGRLPIFGESYDYRFEQGPEPPILQVENLLADGSSILSEPIVPLMVNNAGAIWDPGKGKSRGDRDPFASRPATNEPVLPKTLAEEVENNRLTADINTHRWVISQPGGVRIGVRKSALYHVTRAELEAAGFNVNSDPSLWQLYLEGNEQPIIVEQNGQYIEFLGHGIDTPESDVKMYFLVVGPNPGKRIATRVARPDTGTVISPNYSQAFFLKERTNYSNQIRNGDAENFWGRVITATGTTLNFNLTGVEFGSLQSTITLKFQGFSTSLHQVNIRLNGESISPANGGGQLPFQTTQVIPTSMLREGANSIHFQSNVAGDTNLFDSIEIAFVRRHVAQSGTLAFYTRNDRASVVRGFANPNIRIFDTTIDGHTAELVNLSIQDDGGTFLAKVPAARQAVYFAADSSAVLSPVSITAFDPELLSVPGFDVDLLIIAHKSLLTSAQSWATYRGGQGFDVKVVDVAEAFDEFNFGVVKADAIKSLLHYAYLNWETPPSYVMLLGDASLDPRNYIGGGAFNLVPTRFVNTVFSETGSDEFLADFDNDGLAEIAIGRVPARTTAQAGLVLNKVTRWEANLIDPLSKGVLFAFDLPDGYDFEGMSIRMRDRLPSTVVSTMVGRAQPDSQAVLVGSMNTGKYLVNYAGHGTAGSWASTSFFSNFNVTCTNGAQHCVNNVNNESLFTMLTCLNGFFINTTGDSLAEALLFIENKGAVAAWASTGLTTPDVQEIMGQRYYHQIGLGNIPRLGDLIKDAKTQIPGGTDVRLSWALIGDPMLKVR